MKNFKTITFALLALLVSSCGKSVSLVTLDYNGGHLGEQTSQSIILNRDADNEVYIHPEKEDEEFYGWTTVRDDVTTLNAPPVLHPTEYRQTYYAYFLNEENSEMIRGCKVRFRLNGGYYIEENTPTEFSMPRGTFLTQGRLADDPKRDNYTFAGWSTEPNNIDTLVIPRDKKSTADNFVIADDTVLYALWTGKSITLRIDATIGRTKNTPHGSVKTYTVKTGDVVNPEYYTGANMPYCFNESTSLMGIGTLDFVGFTTKKNDPSKLIDISTWRVPVDQTESVTIYAYWFPHMINVKGGTVSAGHTWSCDNTDNSYAKLVYPRAKADFSIPNLQRITGEDVSRSIVPNAIGSRTGVAFSMCEHLVTQGMWSSIVKGNKIILNGTDTKLAGTIDPQGTFELYSGHGTDFNVSVPNVGTTPVVGHNWYDCVVFCNMLTQLVYGDTAECYYNIQSIQTQAATSSRPQYISGITFGSPAFFNQRKGFRLPTEAEWEWAARGGVPNNSHLISSGTKGVDIHNQNNRWDYNWTLGDLWDDVFLKYVCQYDLLDENAYDGVGGQSTSVEPGAEWTVKDKWIRPYFSIKIADYTPYYEGPNKDIPILGAYKMTECDTLGFFWMCGNGNQMLWDPGTTSGTRRARGGTGFSTHPGQVSIPYRYSISESSRNKEYTLRICSSDRAPVFSYSSGK